MSSATAAERELDALIDEQVRILEEESAQATLHAAKRRRGQSRKSGARGKKCLYSWTCGPRGDAPCPHADFCADWRRPAVSCSRCTYGKPVFDEEREPCFRCTQTKRRGVVMPVDGYCSEGLLDRFQDGARYLR